MSEMRNGHKESGNKAMAVVFLLLLGLCGAAGLLLPDRAFSPQENRYLAMAPVLRLDRLRSGTYMAAVEEYVTDQFPARDFWVSFKALSQRWSGQKENNSVYFADDGYLIGKPQEANPDVTGRNLATVQAMQAAGYDVALLVAPMAAEILRDKLPDLAYTREQSALLEMLRREVPTLLVEVEDPLRLAAADRQVFFRTDHHWTMAGAYEAYRAYMGWLGEDALPLESYEEQIASTDFYGTLWSKNSLPGIQPDEIRIYAPGPTLSAYIPAYELAFFDGTNHWTVNELYQREYLEQKDQYAVFLGQNRPLAVLRRTDGEGTRKLLLFKDSYAHSFAPFLLPHFDEIHLLDLRYWRQDSIAYLEEHGIQQVLFLYNADDFSNDRSISQLSAYLAQHRQ